MKVRAPLALSVLFWTMTGVCSVSFGRQIAVTAQVEFSPNAGSRSVDSSDAVIWLTPLDTGPIQTSQQRGQLLQKRKSFAPHLLVVQVGTPVEFPNQDPFFHNVFSLFEGKRFDLGLYEAGSSRSVVFNRAGISYIFCNIHPEMSAVVIALKTPYYGISDRKGTIAIPNVPPGRYEMKIWHERVLPETLNELTRTIVVAATSNSLGVLRLPEQRNLSQSHKNKYDQDYDNSASGAAVYSRP